MATVVDAIITPAFISLAYIRPGATITTTMRDAAFTLLQQLMTNWSAEQVMAYVVYHQVFTVTAGTSVYTVGTGGSLVSTARPIRITGAVSASGNQRIPVQIMPWEQFDREVMDELSSRSIYAKKMAADQAFPSINIKLWPTPDTAPASLQLDYYAPLPVYAATSDTVTLPEGWEIALQFGLAVALYGQYARPGGQSLEWLGLQLQQYKGAIAAKNAAILGLQAVA